MKNLMVARRYARALYELAHESKTADDVMQGLSNINLALNTSKDLGRVLGNPLVKTEEKTGVIKSITSNKLIIKFVHLLAKRKRMDLLVPVYQIFQEFCDSDNGIHRVLVRTPMKLSDSQKKKVEVELSKKMGGTIVGQYEIAKELIGGVWIKMGDKVLDATVRGKFDDLKHVLVNSSN